MARVTSAPSSPTARAEGERTPWIAAELRLKDSLAVRERCVTQEADDRGQVPDGRVAPAVLPTA